LDITIRGERNHKNCYFRLKDISKGFEMPRLQETIFDDKCTYNADNHYKYFTCIIPGNSGIDHSKKEVYLTYKDILKVLFCSRSGNAESFQDWVTETLFYSSNGY